MDQLTDRQQQILDFIRREVKEKNYPPSVREIGKEVGLASSSTVHSHLSALEKKGYIRRDPTKPRAIELRITDPPPSLLHDVVKVPVVGQVAAGQPILAEDNIEDYFPLPRDYVRTHNVFMLRVRGDSMRNAGILDGDLAIVRQQSTAENSEIVVALLDNEATIKRFFREKKQIRLQPENEFYEPLLSRDVTVIGKVIGIFRHVH
ncbi:MAG: transcriptional repressor LexA [Firmicutes bacterium]|nr:transcriptional repressor LexA [Bacillota bacterium]